MKYHLLSLMLILSLLSSGCVFWQDNRMEMLVIELKYNTDKDMPQNIKSELVTNQSMQSTNARSIDSKKASYAYMNFHAKRRNIVVQIVDEPVQVFEVPISQNIKTGDWTDWKDPIFIDKSPLASFNILHDQLKENRITDIPLEHLQLRYKIEKWE